MLYMFYGVDRPGDEGRTIRTRERAAHLAYLERHGDKVVLGGATLADADDTRTGSVLVVNLPDRAAADAFAADEPFRKGGPVPVLRRHPDAPRPMEPRRRAEIGRGCIV